MSERRQDWVTGQWYILAGDREQRPNEFREALDQPFATACSFCGGHEHETTPTCAQYPAAPADWRVRVVENLYPIVTRSTNDPAHTAADTTRRPAAGEHWVIIEAPEHRRQLTQLPLADVRTVFHAYRDQFRRLRQQSYHASALLFKNSGRDAGMSREHVHSQLIAWPEIPPRLAEEFAGALRYFERQQTCVYCALLAEAEAADRTLYLGPSLAAFCPFASRVPYEVWILPRQHAAHFDEITSGTLEELADFMSQLLLALAACVGPVAYNYLLHTIPFQATRTDIYHWHFELLPRTNRLAGLEWGSGEYVNTVAPESAARTLRDQLAQQR